MNTAKKILEGASPVLGPDCDAAISSRVRIARNFSDFPFPVKLNPEGRKKVIEAVNNAVKNQNNYEFIDFADLSPPEINALMEKRIVSPDFIKGPPEKELIADINDGLYVMVNEEDHLRIQSIKSGFAIYEAYDEANKFDNLADGSLNYAYDENFGYLTQCPTNLGTGMRVSVMLHLPAITLNAKIQNITVDLPKIGLTIRGFYGEGTEVGGDLYQISNNITLGISEEQTLDKIKPVVEKIIELERNFRNAIYKNSKDLITDKIKRAYGTIKNAHMISSGEFLSLYSMLRLGITYGIIQDIDYKILDSLLVKVMPANLSLRFGGEDGEKGWKAVKGKKSDPGNGNKDILRAEYIREILK
ncbi:MAG: protein arginine kinase [Oscillospiraceae bacterium]|nr:protein arginine kinase [Oscillospiraceae bacterium]